MKIILHADDFGFDFDTVQSTIHLFEIGVLTSATIMPNMPFTKLAIDFAKSNPQFSYGIHLTYVDSLKPISNPNKIRSLIDKNGNFLSSSLIRSKSFLGNLSSNEIVEETKRQIGFLIDSKILLSHVDSHGHIHKFPYFQKAIYESLLTFNLNKVRKVQDIFLDFETFSLNNVLKKALNKHLDNELKKKFITTNNFYMPTGNCDINWSDKLFNKILLYPENSTLEIGVHPGRAEKWRFNEFKDIQNFSNLIKGSNHQLINWIDIK